MMPKISHAEVINDQRLKIEFDDGATVIKDLKPLIQRGNLFKAFSSEEFIREFKITDRRRSLLWPNGLEFCADALRMQGEKLSPNRKTKRVESKIKRS